MKKKLKYNDFLESQGYTVEDFKYIKNPPDENDKYLLNDIHKALDLIDQSKRIAVIGDYDCDGVTATATIIKTLRTINKEAFYFIPNRIKDGYGLNVNLVIKAIEEGADTILTVDNGISAHLAIDYAKSQGLKVIVTDHHAITTLPNADAIIHPALGSYPFSSICGCQVAYKLSKAILEKHNIDDPELDKYFLQLSTLSIISDVMPLASKNMDVNENRKWLIKGLESINNTPDKHITNLMYNYEFEQVDETVLGYYLIPSINAIGRIGDANFLVHYFLEEDDICLMQMNETIYQNNEIRKRMFARALEKVEPQYSKKGLAVNVVGENILEGIIGLVAGKYASNEGKVAFCFTKAKTPDGKNTFYKGSGRNDTSINMVEMLNAVPEGILIGYGGHKDACGLSVYEDRLDDFIHFVNEYSDNYAIPNKPYVFHLSKEELGSIENYVKSMKPFGNGFVLPKVEVSLPVQSLMKTPSGYYKLEMDKENESIYVWYKGENKRMEEFLNKKIPAKQYASGTLSYDLKDTLANVTFEVNYTYNKKDKEKKYQYNCVEMEIG